MINSNKIFKLNSNQEEQLLHITPWWDKQLTKLIKQQRGWLRRFNQSVDNYFPQTHYGYSAYPQLVKNVNYFLSFYEAKTKAILKLPRAISKFRRWYQQVETLKALITGIIGLVNFYDTLESNAIPNKRSYIIAETNNFLKINYRHYQESVRAIMPEETYETLDQIYKNASDENDKFFNPILIFNLIHKYITRLMKLKKINEEEFVNLWFKTMSIAIFFQAYIAFQTRLLTNII